MALRCVTAGFGDFSGVDVRRQRGVDVLWACGGNGLLLRSRDRGRSFDRLSVDGKRWALNGVAVGDDDADGIVVVACGGGRVAVSTDDGASFEVTQLGHKQPMHQIAIRGDLVVVAGCHRVAWRRGRGAFKEATLPRGVWSRGVAIDADDNVYVSVNAGKVFRRARDDDEFKVVARWELSRLHAVFVDDADARRVTVVGDAGFIAASVDAGATWTTTPSTTSAHLVGGARRGDVLWLGTTDGGVVRSVDGGASLVDHGHGPARGHRVAADGDLVAIVGEDGVSVVDVVDVDVAGFDRVGARARSELRPS